MGIKVLAPKIVSQIAAGEVIERPASAVKELVENALDAGASQITIEVKSGGISLIRVTDDGAGIPANEIELAFERHATSKVNSLEDLQRIGTLGFRGEALPSMAAVAQVEVLSRSREETTASYLDLEDGSVVQRESQARAPGTTITLHNLFRKVPARLKFLKSAAAESSAVANVISQYALAYPEIRFNLVSDGRTVLRTPGSSKMLDSIAAVYGIEVGRQMLEIRNPSVTWNDNARSVIVKGFVSSPALTRSTREYLSFFVNRRWITNRMLAFAVEEAYHGLLMEGRHPIAAISIGIPPDQVDVNVHPAKTEVKFQDERAVFAAVQRAVRQTLVQTAPVPETEEPKAAFTIPIPGAPSGTERGNVTSPVPEFDAAQSPVAPPLLSLPLLRVLGQLDRSYIVAEGPDALYVLDQHAAHERIQFERILQQRTARKPEGQGLLAPATFEVEPRQEAAMNAHLSDLEEVGFELEAFGNRTYLVRAVPALLRDKDWAAMLREALQGQASQWTENLSAVLACHSAVRAGQVLTLNEMQEMVKQLEKTALPNSCPHGRPTMIQFSTQRLARSFGRT